MFSCRCGFRVFDYQIATALEETGPGASFSGREAIATALYDLSRGRVPARCRRLIEERDGDYEIVGHRPCGARAIDRVGGDPLCHPCAVLTRDERWAPGSPCILCGQPFKAQRLTSNVCSRCAEAIRAGRPDSFEPLQLYEAAPV